MFLPPNIFDNFRRYSDAEKQRKLEAALKRAHSKLKKAIGDLASIRATKDVNEEKTLAIFRIKTSDLTGFIAHSDQLGGPGHPDCEQYWQGIEYYPDIVVDQSLDPFSEEYVNQQVALYREVSGRELDQLTNEHTALDVNRHTAAINPYDHGSPSGLAQHIERLSRAIRLGAPPRGSLMLDMGCGWGL